MALGPSLGGLVAGTAGWRWIFLLNLPVCALAAFLVPRVVAEARDPEGRQLDWPAVALPVQALLHAEGPAAWRAAGVAAGVASGAALVLRQRRRVRPALDVGLLAAREPVGVACVLVALSVGYWAVLVYLPLFLTAAFGFAPGRTGLAMLVATLPMLALPPLGVRLARSLGWRRTFTAALLVLAAGTAAVALAAALSVDGPSRGGNAPVPVLALALSGMAVAGVGAGLINSQVSGALVAMAPPARAGMASGMATTLRQGGFALGIALLGAASGFTGSVGAGDPAFAASFAAAALGATAGPLAAATLLGGHGAPRGA